MNKKKWFLSGFVLAVISIFTIAATDKIVFDRAKLINAGFSPTPVGSIIQSLLTESQFQAINGSSWVIMRGQSISGTTLATITGLTNLPDARGQFLRTAEGSAAGLRTIQSDATKKNGLAITGSVSGGTASGTFASTTHYHDTTSLVAEITFSSDYTYAALVSATYNSSHRIAAASAVTTNVSSMSQGANIQGTTDQPFSGGTASVANTPAANNTLAIGAGDAETRPSNLTVNTFIKIN